MRKIFLAALVVAVMCSCEENNDEQSFMDSNPVNVNSEMVSFKATVKKWYADEDIKFADGSVHHVKGTFRATYEDGKLTSLTLYGELDGKFGVHVIQVIKKNNGDLNFFWDIDNKLYEADTEDMLSILNGFKYEE